MKKEEIEKRFAEINALEPEEPTAEDLAAIRVAAGESDSEAMSLSDYKRNLEEYSGKLVLRIPRSLHRTLKEEARREGVSLNQYMLYRLSYNTRQNDHT